MYKIFYYNLCMYNMRQERKNVAAIYYYWKEKKEVLHRKRKGRYYAHKYIAIY